MKGTSFRERVRRVFAKFLANMLSSQSPLLLRSPAYRFRSVYALTVSKSFVGSFGLRPLNWTSPLTNASAPFQTGAAYSPWKLNVKSGVVDNLSLLVQTKMNSPLLGPVMSLGDVGMKGGLHG